MENFKETLSKALGGDQDALEKIHIATQSENFAVDQKNMLITVTDNLAADATSNAWCLRSMVAYRNLKNIGVDKVLTILFEASRSLEQALKINPNNSYALTQLGYFYRLNDYVGDNMKKQQDFSKAIIYFEKAIALNNPLAMVLRGIMYVQGKGCVQSYQLAIDLFKRAMKLNYGQGFARLANLYQSGKGIEKNYLEAVKLYNQACQLDKRGYESIKQLLRELKESLNQQKEHPDYYEIMYYLELLNWKQNQDFNLAFGIMNNYPEKFNHILQNDKLLSLDERLVLLHCWIKKHATLDDKSALDKLSAAWLKKAKHYLSSDETWKAVWSLQNIPEKSIYYKTACELISTHGYSALKKLNLPQGAKNHSFVWFKSYLKNGIQLGSDLCYILYQTIVTDEIPVKTQLEAIINLLPIITEKTLASLRIEQTLFGTEPVVKPHISYSPELFKITQNAQEDAHKIMQDGLSELQTTDHAKINQVVENFFKKIQIFKANHFYKSTTNTMQDFANIENTLNEINSSLSNFLIIKPMVPTAPPPPLISSTNEASCDTERPTMRSN